MVIRFSARTSLVLFCLAFFAATLARLWPNAWTRWLRRKHRYLAVSFAASHAIHAVAIGCFAVMDPAGYAAATSIASYIFGGIGYAFIIAMTVTSFDRTATAIGARAWRRLHLAGGYYLLFQFMVSFGKRIPDMPLYALFLIPLVAVFALRDDRDGAARASHGADGMIHSVFEHSLQCKLDVETTSKRTAEGASMPRHPTDGISAPTGDALT